MKSTKKLKKLSNAANVELYSCKTIFPFTLFPDRISVDRNKVMVSKKLFFLSRSIETILIKDIRFAHISTNPFFATIKIEVEGYEKNPPAIKYLNKYDAIKLKDIITGLIAAKEENVNLKNIPPKKITQAAEKIGSSKKDAI